MNRFRAPMWLALPVIALIAFGLHAYAATIEVAPGDSAHCATGFVHQTATAADCATPTVAPTGWHPPTTHEHGDAPPSWVVASAHPPFTQTRESHVGYKGMTATQTNGPAESYLITHILTTTMARSHGDHDYQVWVKDSHGGISSWAGQLDFSGSVNDPTAPIPTRTADDGTRPVALAERSPTDGCETWYSRPGRAVFDLGWTVCGRYQKFDGTLLNGTGRFRGADWSIYVARFGTFPGAAPTLAQDCRIEFNTCRLLFVRTGHDNPGPSVQPLN